MGVVKLNVDAANFRALAKNSIGIVAGDHDGKPFLLMFQEMHFYETILQAEALVIFYALLEVRRCG